MPSAEHDLVVEMFVHRPELGPRLLELGTGIALPPGAGVRTVSADLSAGGRNAYGDVAIVVDHTPGVPRFGVSVEIQVSADRTRDWVWPIYLVVLRRQLERDTELLVFCPDNLVQRYRRPIRWGLFGGNVVEPVVVGYSDIPPITSAVEARELPELAVLSAAAHATDPECGHAVLRALRPALDELAPDRGARYLNYIRIRNAAERGRGNEEVLDMGFVMNRPLREFDEYPMLVEAYRRLGWKRGLAAGHEQGLEQGLEQGREQGLEQGREQGLEQGVGQGREQGLVHAVLTVLRARGLEVGDPLRARLEQCHDQAELERLLKLASTAREPEELLGSGAR